MTIATTCCASADAGKWKAARGPLKTRWAADVDPRNVLPEYPRPQMVRRDWMNLNGLWQFDSDAKESALPIGRDLPETILVPFPPESALSGVMKPVDRVCYRRSFELPAKWTGKRLLLHFGAVDWETTVAVNGKPFPVHRGGYDPFSFDITDALKPSGPQELVVAVYDPTDNGNQPRGKQITKPHGIWYTPASGIWQTVWLEPVPDISIDSLKIVPDVDGKCVHLTAKTSEASGGMKVRIEVLDGTKRVAEAVGKPGTTVTLPVRSARLWSPDKPFLYGLRVALTDGTRDKDSVKSYFGMRKIAVESDGKVNRLMLNNKFVFQVGTLDQGYWPDGIYTAPTDEALRYDIEITKKLGFNMIRKHVKIEPARWYYWCDKLGVLVWQDMPSANNKTPGSKLQYETELRAMVESHWNSPAIVMWVVFNEGWGQFDTERLTRMVKKLDPSRLANNASGWTDKKVGDVIDMHKYPDPGCPEPEARRAAVLGEFGGLGHGVKRHTWTKESWGYVGFKDIDALARRYQQLFSHVWRLKKDPGLCAVVYTQITDVETECNGLLTYDRAVLKIPARTIVDANLGKVPVTRMKEIVLTSRTEPAMWRYTFDKPTTGTWIKPDYDDSSWKEGPGGFGTEGTPGAVIGTTWDTPDIWMRREIKLPAKLSGDLYFLLHHDEDVEIYLNGVLAAKDRGFLTEYTEASIRPGALPALKPGTNTIAVHCRNTTAGQFIDVGIVAIKKR